MREYIRRTCSHGWIINVTPEGNQPPAANAVFNIETPVAIALFLRQKDTDADQPSRHQVPRHPRHQARKFDALAELDL